jgi:hypothetical protein
VFSVHIEHTVVTPHDGTAAAIAVIRLLWFGIQELNERDYLLKNVYA